ncbi:amidohydrolase [Alicyclobacillus mengziensis]|uniref:Amidohydrolase n=1 Tax=Alicyclobacillus mengziensis TaxID=2931921 RepID=A0A9X7Z6E5_9BACL|nr:amidohydrolase [Alicyclobacillus mengziensis]QSO47282.1 amidohydrolase [Alicyclobacillus mengziensis]
MVDMIFTRRDLHQHPEVGFTEFRTASHVVKTLKSLGYQVFYGADAIDLASRRGVPADEQLNNAYERAIRDGADVETLSNMKGGLTAVVATLQGKAPGPTIAFRFDMDALPIIESEDADHIPANLGFRSVYDGNMHACGHDGHTAIGLALAERMTDANFAGTLKLIFQPAEEGGRGAYAMAQKGVVNDVDKLFCLHLGLDTQLGEIYGGSTDFLATTKLMIEFQGVPSHAGATPEKGRNALLGAATALLNIHALPRFSSSTTRINVGLLQGGTALNIIPYYAKMLVETRAADKDANKELERRVRVIAENSAAMHELDCSVTVIGEATTMTCDEGLVELVLDEARKVEGFSSFHHYHKAGASEDASFLIRAVQEHGGQATYMVIGTPIPAPHHNQKFDIDEAALPMAVNLLERIGRRALTGGDTRE